MTTPNPIYKLLTWLVLLLGLAGSGAASYWIKLNTDAREYQQFVYYCEEIKLKIASRLEVHEQTVLSGAVTFDASQEVTRQEWQVYVKRLLLNEHFNGIQGLGFAKWIPATRLAAHQASIHAVGFPDYKVHPEGQREAYAPITFIEPFTERNLRAFGYDMYAESVRRAAMERARDENIVTLSGKVTLVQETDKNIQAGTLMYVPVYEKNKPIATVEQRRAALFGWVYSPFRMNDLLNDIIKTTQVHLQVYDGNNTQAEHLLYDNNIDHADSNSTDHRLLVQMTNDFNGTTWTLQFEQIREANGLADSKAWITLSAGILISLLLFLLSHSYLTTRITAANIAARLTEHLQASESHFRIVADFVPVLIWLSGIDKRCHYFNKCWLDFTGRTFEQEQGCGWAEGVHPDDLHRCLNTYMTAFDARLPFKMEYRLRRYDGEYRWMLDAGVPRFADDGAFLGYIGSCMDITERKQAEAELHASEARFRSIIDISPLPMGLSDAQQTITFLNPAFIKTFGYDLTDIPTLADWWPRAFPDPDYRQWAMNSWRISIEQVEREHKAFVPLEITICCKDGTQKTVLLNAAVISQPSIDTHLVVFYDITERKQAETDLRIAATVFETQEGMIVADADCVILKVNQAFTRITGYSATDVINKNPRLLSSGQHDQAFYAALWQHLHETGAWQGEIWNRRKNGEIYPEWLTITAVKNNNNGAITHYVATLTDITERKTTEETINRLAFYDHLTQLPNRRLLYERLKHGIELNHRTGSQMAVLMMDLDEFKAVNDTLGHAAGDELLQQVAKRVKTHLREVDMVARLGGDEFVILIEIEHSDHYKNVSCVAENIIHALKQPFTLCQNNEVYIGASIGIAIHPEHGDSVETLMDNADAALYHAKDQGRGCFVYFYEALTHKTH